MKGPCVEEDCRSKSGQVIRTGSCPVDPEGPADAFPPIHSRSICAIMALMTPSSFWNLSLRCVGEMASTLLSEG